LPGTGASGEKGWERVKSYTLPARKKCNAKKERDTGAKNAASSELKKKLQRGREPREQFKQKRGLE